MKLVYVNTRHGLSGHFDCCEDLVVGMDNTLTAQERGRCEETDITEIVAF